METKTIDNPVVKAAASIATATGAQVIDSGARAGSLFADLLVLSWPNIASMAAALYTVLLVSEWFWKKVWRPVFERCGWIKPKPRRVLTADEWARLAANADTDRGLL